MGNGQSEVGNSKPPDKCVASKCSVEPTGNKKRVLCNIPYLTALFKKLARQSNGSPGDADVHGDSGPERVTKPVFEETFNGPLKVLGHLLFDHIKAASKTERRESIHLDEFLQVASEVLGLVTNGQQLDYYADMFSNRQDFITVEMAYHIVQVCFAVSQKVACLPFEQLDSHDTLLRALAASIAGPHGKTAKQEFISWCTKHIPHLFNGVHSFLKTRLSGTEVSDMERHKRMAQDTESNATVSMLATLDEGGSALTYSVLWLLTASLPNLYVIESRQRGAKSSLVPNFLMSRMQMMIENRPWCCLYDSNDHGLSTNGEPSSGESSLPTTLGFAMGLALQWNFSPYSSSLAELTSTHGFEHHVFSYKGPTVMIISFDHNLYVLATDQEWRESSVCWGGENTVLYQLCPRFALVDSGRLVFLNHHTRGVFKGITLGSDPKSPAIKIEDMSTVQHYGVNIKLSAVEVWGCATAEIRNIQLKHKAWEKKEVEKLHNRKLKLENWEDNPDRMLLNWVGISTNHHEKA